MKLFLLALSGIVAASASASSSEHVTLRGSATESVTEYSPPKPTTDLESLWNELVAEAVFMQNQISEGRTYSQCVDDCNNAKDINRARCARNCEQIDDNGGSSNNKNSNCDDCRDLPENGRRRERCMDACRQGQIDNIDRCLDARTCGECRDDCGTGIALDDCLDDLDCPGQDRSDRRSCSSARTCGECNSFCDSNRDRRDCRDDNCTGEQLAKFEEIFIQK